MDVVKRRYLSTTCTALKILQGNAAKDFRRGGKFNSGFLMLFVTACNSELLRSVGIFQIYRRNKSWLPFVNHTADKWVMLSLSSSFLFHHGGIM